MRDYTVVAVLYTTAQTALLACIRYWLYQNSLRVCARRMYGVVFAIALGAAALWIGTGGLPGMSFNTFRLWLALAMFALSCCVIREPFTKHTYTYSFIMVYDSAIEITASFAQTRLMPGARDWVFVLSAALLVALSFVFAVRCLKRMIERVSAAANDRLWGWLCVISFSFVFMNLLFTFPPTEGASLRDLFSRYLMLLGVIGLYAATTRAVETMREAADAKAERDLADRRIALQQGYYDRMSAQMDEVRRIRHDLRHHRAALMALVQSGDTAALAAYMDAAPAPEEALPVTGNFAADSVLLYYIDEAKALGVSMQTDLALGRETPLSDPDLCVILGNLLENAMDAQKHLAPQRRYIRVTAKGDAQSLVLAVDNRFDGTLARDARGAYLSRKEGAGHGLGLGSVRMICERYGGILQLETEGDLFMAGVVIGV